MVVFLIEIFVDFFVFKNESQQSAHLTFSMQLMNDGRKVCQFSTQPVLKQSRVIRVVQRSTEKQREVETVAVKNEKSCKSKSKSAAKSTSRDKFQV